MAINHSAHDHPNTRAARLACRKELHAQALISEATVESTLDSLNRPAIKDNDSFEIISVPLNSLRTYDLKTGMRVHFDKLVKYNGYDHNFYGYCGKCKENKCKEPISISEYVEGEIIEVIRWADNSTDIKVQTDDGKKVIHQVEAPHGDICF